jgi:hypothetical protein
MGLLPPEKFLMNHPTNAQHPRLSLAFALAGVIVGLVIVLGVGPPGLVLSHETECQLGQELGTYTIWTPMAITNIPEGGSVSTATDAWNLTMTSGSLTTNPLTPLGSEVGSGFDPGSYNGTFAEYQDFNWTFYRTANVSVLDGSAGPCTQPFMAEMTVPGDGCGGGAAIPLPDNSSDASEPHVWNGTAQLNGSESVSGCPVQTPGTYVWFDSSFHAGGTGTSQQARWDRCNSPGYAPLTLVGNAQVPIAVTVPYGAGDISVRGMLTWHDTAPFTGATAVYEVPGGWVWTLAPVGPAASAIDPSQPLPGLVAFERSPC